jgi:hypothetical protein
LMTSWCKQWKLASGSFAQTTSPDSSFPGYLRTLQTIQKSEPICRAFEVIFELTIARALIGTVRPLGQKPCPRCLVRKCDIHQMGTPEDTALRISQPRRDSDDRQKLVKSAQHIILEEGYAVASDKVEYLLKPDSLLPTQVRGLLDHRNPIRKEATSPLTECLFENIPIGLRCLL